MQVRNLTSAGAASLHQGVAALSAQIASLQARLADMLPQFEGVREEVQQLEGMVVDEVRERMGRLRGRLEDQINQVLNPNSLPTGAPHGRWPAVWSMAKAIWRLGRGGGGRGTLEGDLPGNAPCVLLWMATIAQRERSCWRSLPTCLCHALQRRWRAKRGKSSWR